MREGRSTPQKIALIAAGYAGALLLAWGVVYLYVITTNTPDRQSSAGMYAFGDSVLFLGVFTVAAIPATAGALYFLRPVLRFWSIASVTALAMSATALVALTSYVVPDWRASAWSTAAPLRLLLAPALGIACLLALLFAPNWSSRRLLIAATAIEFGSFAWFAIVLFNSQR